MKWGAEGGGGGLKSGMLQGLGVVAAGRALVAAGQSGVAGLMAGWASPIMASAQAHPSHRSGVP